MFTRVEIDVVTDANGDAEVYTTPLNGRIYSIQYVKDSSTPYANGVDFTLTLQNADDTDGTGEILWAEDSVDASDVISPRQPTHDNTNTNSKYIASGEDVEDYYIACNERVKIVLANGGAAKTGKFYIKAG